MPLLLALALAAGSLAAQECTKDGCPTHVVPKPFSPATTLGSWLETRLTTQCSNELERYVNDEEDFESKEAKDAFESAVYGDKTALNGDSGKRLLAALQELSGGDSDKPDCSKIAHYLLHSPAYFKIADRVFLFAIVRNNDAGAWLAPVSNDSGATNFVSTDLLARRPKSFHDQLEVFGGKSDEERASVRMALLKKLAPPPPQ